MSQLTKEQLERLIGASTEDVISDNTILLPLTQQQVLDLQQCMLYLIEVNKKIMEKHVGHGCETEIESKNFVKKIAVINELITEATLKKFLEISTKAMKEALAKSRRQQGKSYINKLYNPSIQFRNKQ